MNLAKITNFGFDKKRDFYGLRKKKKTILQL